MARKYYTLCVRDYGNDGKGVWSPQFGDYDREVVTQEADDTYSRDYKRRDLKVITTGDTQAAINAGVAKLNA